jgi:hypothetical protein
MKLTREDFTRIASDVYGNPRYYVPGHLVTESAIRSRGGVKYRGKQFGAGWVIQSYSIEGDIAAINATATTGNP